MLKAQVEIRYGSKVMSHGVGRAEARSERLPQVRSAGLNPRRFIDFSINTIFCYLVPTSVNRLSLFTLNYRLF